MRQRLLIYVFQSISTVEELADISANVVLDTKLSTWMLLHKSAYIKNHIVKNNKLLPILYSFLELL